MAKKKAARKMQTTLDESKTSQARLELPASEMERVRQAAKSVGLSLSAFIRRAVLTEAARTEREMGKD